MKITYTKSFDKTLKNLKNKKQELEVLDKIIKYIRKEKDFTSIINNPLSKMYGLERLKYELNDFYSFRLSKIVRLIVKPNEDYLELSLVYISTKHYEDFNNMKVIYYD